MNSWIGGSLSSLKGQLTHLITEGTEEVIDPKGDLIIAKQNVNDLENQIRTLTSDVKDLNEKNNELKIKLQSEEMLMETVSNSYKEKLKQKEDCIDAMRLQLSSNVLSYDNDSGLCVQSDHILFRGEEWPSEFCDFVNQSSTQMIVSRCGVSEVDSLRQKINDLNQEVLRWRTMAESFQSNRQDNIGDSEETPLVKLLEMQRQDLELQHSNDILELQQEHNKQLSFWKRSSVGRHRSSENDDCELSYNNIEVATNTQLDCLSKATNTCVDDSDWSEMTCEVACQCVLETPAMDIAAAAYDGLPRLSQSSGHNIADSLSQVSDISEVSIRSRILDEQVRQLSSQLTGIDDNIALMTSVNNDNDNDPEIVAQKLQHLKMKLSLRKNIIIEQNNLLINPETVAVEATTCGDSWENSSDNSLVQEPNMDIKLRMDQERLINDIYRIIFSLSPSNDTGVLDTLSHIKDMVTSMLNKLDSEKLFRENLTAFIDELVGSGWSISCDNNDWCRALRAKFTELNYTIDSFAEKYSKLEDVVLTHEHDKAVLETEIIELAKKNRELEEKLDDMSSTIRRYESLEKVCDTYEKELNDLKGCSKKVDLGMDSEDILEHVKTFNEEKDEIIEKLESRIISLQNFCEEKDDYIKAMKEREREIIYEYDCSIDVLTSELDSVRGTVEKSYENEVEYKKQIYRMNASIREKDDMIQSLNEELTMLSHHSTDEDIAPGPKNDSVETSSQTYETKIIEYGEAYAGMLGQTNVLIAENKRLEQVVEAQANSLGQYEARINSLNCEIARLNRCADGVILADSSEEMTRDTLHHLSQMIRDKDWEIEALKSKNVSLCSIIKQSGESSEIDVVSPIDKLLNEKEALSKEVQWYQENREQLVNALNLKHKESLNYHGEIQRLVAFINNEQMRWNELSSENEQIKEQIRILSEEKVHCKSPEKYLVDTAVEFRDKELPTYDECMGSGNNVEQCKTLKERVSALELENRNSFGEIRRLEKQLEHVSFELEESRLQLTELRTSHDRCQTQMTHYQEELTKMCNADVESSQLTEATKDIWSETEESDAAVMGSEEQLIAVDTADQVRMYQLQCEDYLHQIDQLKAKETKLLKEKQIFQDHLIRIEESYTQDATIAEDREQSLRIQLRKTEDQLSLSQDRVTELDRRAVSLSENLLSQTCVTRQERDEALRLLRDCEARLSDTVSSLNNLQAVLDKFQQEQALELTFQRERFQQELRSMMSERDKWQSQCNELQLNMAAQTAIVEAAQRLTDQMERKDDQLAEMQATMSRKEEVIDNLKLEIRKLNSVTESKVDKILMRNLVIGYFHTPLNKRQDALRVIGSLLQFSDKDYHQIGIDTVNKSRWFSWLRSPGPDPKDHDSHSQEHSFSELFIRFLERESMPLPQLRLPTNQIAADARQHSSLSQSNDLAYVTSAPSVQTQSVLDHHKFFTSSPLVTKRNGPISGTTSVTEASADLDGSLLFICSLHEPKPRDSGPHNSKSAPVPSLQSLPPSSLSSSLSSSHRRADSNRNALLSLLEQ